MGNNILLIVFIAIVLYVLAVSCYTIVTKLDDGEE